MSNKIWYLPGPFHQYRENVKELAKEYGLRIVDANVTEDREGEAVDVPEVTLRQAAPVPVLVIDGQGGVDGAALQELIDKLNAERDSVVLLIEAAEGLAPLEHPGAGELPIRLFDALTSIHEGIASLKSKRDELLGEVESLRAEVVRLTPAPQSNGSALDDLTVVQIKEQLDAKGVGYKVNDSKPELLALLKAHQ
ncbi:hypothetical protein CQ009_12900 [Pseudomonas sp. MYb2]|uniref:hypothetical protein n=1 Tax=unclassified Pseudomonas TaxID=196821 RepID=UPI000CFF91E3|nr:MULTISPECIES: hypothetical protein [unclassified Pseudomonas]PRB51176.1 hypothetical protein CQ025_09545 [Pseudomonas sp. MYb3]PRC34555.1 hypothetical protein CQ009_12900 [Pseudomonas sp. MYb2]